MAFKDAAGARSFQCAQSLSAGANGLVTALIEGYFVCWQYPSLEGREGFVREQLERTYQYFLEKHSHLAQDERSQTHLQVFISVFVGRNNA